MQREQRPPRKGRAERTGAGKRPSVSEGAGSGDARTIEGYRAGQLPHSPRAGMQTCAAERAESPTRRPRWWGDVDGLDCNMIPSFFQSLSPSRLLPAVWFGWQYSTRDLCRCYMLAPVQAAWRRKRGAAPFALVAED